MTKHGMHLTRVYRTWSHMKSRCNNPKDKAYYLYGGRGIKVCERWHDFQNFWGDVKGDYDDSLSIERIDSNGDYKPSNVIWVPISQQAKNTRAVRWYTHDGETMSLSDWARKTGLSFSCLWHRLNGGMDFATAITKPSQR